MADDEDGAVVVSDKAAQPLDALEVQVVSGLVQKQQVGVAQEELGQRDAHLPAARELGARALKVGDFKAQTGQDFAGVAFELVAAQVLKAVLDLAVLVKERVDVLSLSESSVIRACSSLARSPMRRISLAAAMTSARMVVSLCSRLVSCSR